jgi:hypothetical protein
VGIDADVLWLINVPASTQYNISHCVILAGAGGLMSRAQLTTTITQLVLVRHHHELNH